MRGVSFSKRTVLLALSDRSIRFTSEERGVGRPAEAADSAAVIVAPGFGVGSAFSNSRIYSAKYAHPC